MTSRINEAEKKKLEKLKEDWGLKSINEVISKLLSMHENDGGPDGSDSDSNGPMSEEETPGRVKQLFSFDDLKVEPKAMKWWTGLNKRTLNWVIQALEDAVRSGLSLWCFPVWTCGRGVGRHCVFLSPCFETFFHSWTRRQPQPRVFGVHRIKDTGNGM